MSKKSVAIFAIAGAIGFFSFYQRENSHSYPQKHINAFMDGCVQSGGADLEQEQIKSLCTCSINELQEQYTFGEFRKLGKKYETSKVLPPELQDIVMSCAQKLG
ncbi:hypothetical protein [Acaryochloris sp. IP29b_bin.137]|uniref:hypothetical protein n=1 Tax=Acaryochloris sp. IP29b_bin.137 TaxID=2969217 RepID=UPI0026038853|nr:hypothetical protein [Acaryochloris sp. IP29b_bin.137]